MATNTQITDIATDNERTLLLRAQKHITNKQNAYKTKLTTQKVNDTVTEGCAVIVVRLHPRRPLEVQFGLISERAGKPLCLLGGKIKTNETFASCLTRECVEEIGSLPESISIAISTKEFRTSEAKNGKGICHYLVVWDDLKQLTYVDYGVLKTTAVARWVRRVVDHSTKQINGTHGEATNEDDLAEKVNNPITLLNLRMQKQDIPHVSYDFEIVGDGLFCCTASCGNVTAKGLNFLTKKQAQADAAQKLICIIDSRNGIQHVNTSVVTNTSASQLRKGELQRMSSVMQAKLQQKAQNRNGVCTADRARSTQPSSQQSITNDKLIADKFFTVTRPNAGATTFSALVRSMTTAQLLKAITVASSTRSRNLYALQLECSRRIIADECRKFDQVMCQYNDEDGLDVYNAIQQTRDDNDILDLLGILSDRFVSNSHIQTSQINGANGEYTGLDDVDQATENTTMFGNVIIPPGTTTSVADLVGTRTNTVKGWRRAVTTWTISTSSPLGGGFINCRCAVVNGSFSPSDANANFGHTRLDFGAIASQVDDWNKQWQIEDEFSWFSIMAQEPVGGTGTTASTAKLWYSVSNITAQPITLTVSATLYPIDVHSISVNDVNVIGMQQQTNPVWVDTVKQFGPVIAVPTPEAPSKTEKIQRSTPETDTSKITVSSKRKVVETEDEVKQMFDKFRAEHNDTASVANAYDPMYVTTIHSLPWAGGFSSVTGYIVPVTYFAENALATPKYPEKVVTRFMWAFNASNSFNNAATVWWDNSNIPNVFAGAYRLGYHSVAPQVGLANGWIMDSYEIVEDFHPNSLIGSTPIVDTTPFHLHLGGRLDSSMYMTSTMFIYPRTNSSLDVQDVNVVGFQTQDFPIWVEPFKPENPPIIYPPLPIAEEIIIEMISYITNTSNHTMADKLQLIAKLTQLRVALTCQDANTLTRHAEKYKLAFESIGVSDADVILAKQHNRLMHALNGNTDNIGMLSLENTDPDSMGYEHLDTVDDARYKVENELLMSRNDNILKNLVNASTVTRKLPLPNDVSTNCKKKVLILPNTSVKVLDQNKGKRRDEKIVCAHTIRKGNNLSELCRAFNDKIWLYVLGDTVIYFTDQEQDEFEQIDEDECALMEAGDMFESSSERPLKKGGEKNRDKDWKGVSGQGTKTREYKYGATTVDEKKKMTNEIRSEVRAGLKQGSMDREAHKKRVQRADKRLNRVLNTVEDLAAWILSTSTDKISDETLARIYARKLESLPIVKDRNNLKTDVDHQSQIATALFVRSLNLSLPQRAVAFYYHSSLLSGDTTYLAGEQIHETSYKPDGYAASLQDARNKLIHAINGNIYYSNHIELMSNKQRNKLMHALNGNTTTNTLASATSTTEATSSETMVQTTLTPLSVVPAEKAVIGNTLAATNVPKVSSNMMKMPEDHLGMSPPTAILPFRELSYDLAKTRGYTQSSGKIFNNIDLQVGDLFMREQSFDNTTTNNGGSMCCREALGTPRALVTAAILSTQRLRVLNVLGITGAPPQREYLLTSEASNIQAMRYRIRADTTTVLGFYASDLLVYADLGVRASDDWSYNYSKLFALMYALHPNDDDSGTLPLRGPLELMDSTFHASIANARNTIVGFNDSPVFGENCSALGVRYFPYVDANYSPNVAFHVNMGSVPRDEIPFLIAAPTWLTSWSIQMLQIFLRLLVLLFTPGPHGLFTWQTSLDILDDLLWIPFAQQIAFTGSLPNTWHVLLPVHSGNIPVPTTYLDANRAALFLPTVGGIAANINAVGLPVVAYPLLEWVDEFVNDTLHPSTVATFLAATLQTTGCKDKLLEAKARVQAWTCRGAPLIMHHFGAAIPPAIWQPRVNTGDECDISGADVIQLPVDLPVAPEQTDYLFQAGTAMVWTTLAINAFSPSKYDNDIKLGWLKEEYWLAQMLCRRYLMTTQILHDMLGLSANDLGIAGIASDNSLLREFVYNLWSGSMSISNTMNTGQASNVYDVIASHFLETSFPHDTYGFNVLAYKNTPLRYSSMYPNGFPFPTLLLKLSLYPDSWMDAWTKKHVVEYSQAPGPMDGNVKLSLSGNNKMARGTVNTTISSFVPPWDLNNPEYISSNNWFTEDDRERRINRRAMLWLQRSVSADGQPGMNTIIATSFGNVEPTYATCPMDWSASVNQAASAVLGFTDCRTALATKLDPYPLIDTASWAWLVICGDLTPANRTLGFALLANNITIPVSRQIPITDGYSPINILPGREQTMNPLAKMFAISTAADSGKV